MIKIGLTGAIGSGKSALAKLVAGELGMPVFDADQVVHDLYAQDGILQQMIVTVCGTNILNDGKIDRAALANFRHAPENAVAWQHLEALIHERVWEQFNIFAHVQSAAGHDVVIADVPFIFESGAETRFDYVIAIDAPYELQKIRTLARAVPRLSADEFARRHAAFMPAAQRNRLADFVIDNGGELAAGLLQLRAHIATIRRLASGASDKAPALPQAAVCAGSFDPMTLAHVDIIKSAVQMPFARLYVAVGINPAKTPLFPVAERLAMIEREMDRDVRPFLPPGQQIIVTSYDGLTVDFMASVGASFCIRGLRGNRDMEQETELAAINQGLYADQAGRLDQRPYVQAYFTASRPELRHVSSSAARAICASGPGQDLSLLHYVSADVAARLIARRDQRSI